MSLPPLVARLIGIGKYCEYPHLKPEGDTNAEILGKFLKDEFTDSNPARDIKTVTKDVTRDKIIETINELGNTVDRSKATLFFFSGYGGPTVGGPSVICPADIGKEDKSKAITDEELLQYFDSLSRSRGNNITFLLDCPSSKFEWKNPLSFVVIAPRTVPDWNHRAFTNAVIKVLRSEKDSLSLLTVQSFAAKVHAAMPDGIEIDCHGRNINRLLFNPTKGIAHHAFIPGRAETDGSFTLFAGSAHGVTKGSTFGIYTNHVAQNQSPVGHLKVEGVPKSTTSKLCLLNANSDFAVPPVFYAVTTYCPEETVDVLHSRDVNIRSSVGWNKTEKAEEANITLERISNSDKVKVFWNGFASPGIRINPESDDYLSSSADELVKVIRHAARFKRIVGSLANSPSPPLFKVEFRRFDEDDNKPTGGDLLEDKLVKLDIKKDNKKSRFCLVLRNVAKFEIWPCVFRCDPTKFTIEPWYTAKQPLAPQGELIIGRDDVESLIFPWKSHLEPAFTYLKIFATKAPTSFLFLTQYRLPDEDKFREVGATAAPNGSDGSDNPQSSRIIQSNIASRKSNEGDWQTMQITIKRKYVKADRIRTMSQRLLDLRPGGLK